MGVEKFETKNGITVIIDHIPHLETSSINARLKVGSRSETDSQHGISHLLEHMAFKGTKNRSAREIVEEIESVGGELNAATNVEYTTYYARVLKEDVGLGIDILSDLMISPVIEPMELEREKHVVLQEIGANFDSPEDYVCDIFQQTAWPDQPIGRSILGTRESVKSFTSGDIRNYMDLHYRGPCTVIAVAGAVNSDEVAQQIEKHFASMPSEDFVLNAPANYAGGESLERRNLQEVQIMLGFEGLPYNSGNFLDALILASILGGGMSSRLFQEVREERGLCYSIDAFHWAFEDTGIFTVSAATGDDDVKELMPVVLNVLKRAATDITEEEVVRASAQVKASLMMALESPVTRANQLTRQQMAYGRVLDRTEIVEKLESIKAADLRNLVSNLILSGKPTLSAIGPVDNLLSLEDISNCLQSG